MAAAKKKPVMDVSRPGKAPATPTARPILTSPTPMSADPMVKGYNDTDEAPTNAVDPDKHIATPHREKTIQPLEDESTSKSESAAETESGADDTAEPPEVVATDAADPALAEETKADSDTETNSEGAVVGAIVDQMTDQQREKQQQKDDQAASEKVDQLIAAKTYAVPVHKASSGGHGLAITAVVVGLSIVAVTYLVLSGTVKQLPFGL